MKRIYFCVRRNLTFVPLPPLFLLTSCSLSSPTFFTLPLRSHSSDKKSKKIPNKKSYLVDLAPLTLQNTGWNYKAKRDLTAKKDYMFFTRGKCFELITLISYYFNKPIKPTVADRPERDPRDPLQGIIRSPGRQASF